LDRGWGKATQPVDQDLTVHGSALSELFNIVSTAVFERVISGECEARRGF